MLNDKDAYDIAKIYDTIERELIDDMMKNFARHRAEETKEGYDWEQWQVLQLQALEEYKNKNLQKYTFKGVRNRIKHAITNANTVGGADAEKLILRALKKGLTAKRQGSEQFFKVNENRVNALIDAVQNDLGKAQNALLRKANDEYRKIIFKTQVQASTGSITYEKAVDLATKDFLTAGIQCIQYKNGAMHTISNYAEMAMRTSMKRAYLQGEGYKREEWGVHTVIVNHRNHACSKCLPFVGRVLIDDVYSGGTSQEASALKLPTLSSAMDAGLFHPNCKDGLSTYFEGISDPPQPMTKQEKAYATAYEQAEDNEQTANNKYHAFTRLAKYALDPQDKNMYLAKADEWKAKRDLYANQKQSVDIGQVISDKIEQNIQGNGSQFTAQELLHMLQNQSQLTGTWEAWDVHFADVGETIWDSDPTMAETFEKGSLPNVAEKLQLTDSAKGYIYSKDKAIIMDELVVISKTKQAGVEVSKVAVRGTMTVDDYHELIENLMAGVKDGSTELDVLVKWEREALGQVTSAKADLDLQVQALGGLKKSNPLLAEANKVNLKKARLSKWEKQWETSVKAYDDYLQALADDVDILDNLNAEKSILEKELQTDFDEAKEYVGIWKDPVTLNDYKSKKDKVQAKLQYFMDEFNKAKIGSPYEQKMQDMMKLTNAYKKEGEAYLAKVTEIEDKLAEMQAVKDKEEALLAIAKTGRVPKPKKAVDKFADMYTQERKDKALWFKDELTARKYFDNLYRQFVLDRKNSSGRLGQQFASMYSYTSASGGFNRPLSGFEAPRYSGGSGWNLAYFKGAGKVSLDNEGKGAFIKGLTEMIDEAPTLPEDTWVQSGQGYGTLAGFLNNKFSQSKLMSMTDAELQQFVGVQSTIPAFVSTGMVKGGGFSSKPTIMNIYLPKGSKGLFVTDLGAFGYMEQEYILQRGGTYRITKIYRDYGTLYIDLELRLEEGYDTFWVN